MTAGLWAALAWPMLQWVELGRFSTSSISMVGFYIVLYATVMSQHRRARRLHTDAKGEPSRA